MQSQPSRPCRGTPQGPPLIRSCLCCTVHVGSPRLCRAHLAVPADMPSKMLTTKAAIPVDAADHSGQNVTARALHEISVRTTIAVRVCQPRHTDTTSPHQQECIDRSVCRGTRNGASPRASPTRHRQASSVSDSDAGAGAGTATPATAAAVAVPHGYASQQRRRFMLPLVNRSVKVLGHVVSAEGVAIADDDKAALLQLPRPTTVGVFLGGQLIGAVTCPWALP